MNKNIIITGLVTLAVGFAIGYVAKPNKESISQPMSHDPSSIEQTMGTMVDSLKGKKGDNLDLAFLEEMIVHHEGAVAMAKELQKGTKRPELQKMANDIISVQTTEINMMKGWLTEWFGR
jgi:uncharacterized protein (DUF305 family)